MRRDAPDMLSSSAWVAFGRRKGETKLLSFIVTAAVISLSGVMAPGPITAATLAAGLRHRHAGALIGAGHVAVELPLILLVAGGVGVFLSSDGIRAAIGLVGGAVLVYMGVQLLRSLRGPAAEEAATAPRRHLWTGIVLTIANPYFILWWLTVGLSLTTQALEFGLVAVALFAAVHWMCDVGWLELLSYTGNKGSTFLAGRGQKAVTAVCGGALLLFGAKFVIDAAANGF